MQRRPSCDDDLAMPALTLTGRVFAAPPGSPRFLPVFLRGGYDCAMLVYPTPALTTTRRGPTSPSEAHRSGGGRAVALDSDWSLAPALRFVDRAAVCPARGIVHPFAGRMTCREGISRLRTASSLGNRCRVADLRSGFLSRWQQSSTAPRRSHSQTHAGLLPWRFRYSQHLPEGCWQAGVPTPPGIHSLRHVRRPSTCSRRSRMARSCARKVGHVMEEEMKEANKDAITPKGF